MFGDKIKEYEGIRKEYQQKIADRMGKKQWMEYNEILFSAYSCAIEGNSFTVDDTRILCEQGMAMVVQVVCYQTSSCFVPVILC